MRILYWRLHAVALDLFMLHSMLCSQQRTKDKRRKDGKQRWGWQKQSEGMERKKKEMVGVLLPPKCCCCSVVVIFQGQVSSTEKTNYRFQLNITFPFLCKPSGRWCFPVTMQYPPTCRALLKPSVVLLTSRSGFASLFDYLLGFSCFLCHIVHSSADLPWTTNSRDDSMFSKSQTHSFSPVMFSHVFLVVLCFLFHLTQIQSFKN